MDDFAVSDLPLAGGLLGVSPIPGRTRHYPADLARLLDWRPDLVISMTTQSEMVQKGSWSLGKDLEARDIAWRHLPVADYGAPGPKACNDWPGISQEALHILGGNGRVLVHCFGGCGRSGMVALRLMCDAGEPALPALERLRQSRPCAVETREQAIWSGGTDLLTMF